MNNINEAQNDNKKRRGRPRGSKNKPKYEEIKVESKLRSNTEKKIPIKVAKKVIKKQLDTFFIIKPRSGGKCYYQTEITVDYTPHKEHDTSKVSIVPRINTDNKPHIPGFIMDMDKGYYDKHDQRYKEDHEAKITDYTKPKSRLYQPKPGKRHNYCCVCKQSYEDYLEHVQSSQHKKHYNQNEFSNFISKISKDYENNNRNNMKHLDQPEVLTDTLTPQEDDNDCQLLNLTDSATQKYGNKNHKSNKANPHQFNNLIHSNQMLKKAQSHINPKDQIKNNFLQKSVSVNIKGQQQNGANNYHDGVIAYQQNPSTQASCLDLNTKQPLNSNYLQPIFPRNIYTNIPQYLNSNDNEIIVAEVAHNPSNNNSMNNVNNNNSNVNRAIKNTYMNNTQNTTLNGKRKSDVSYNDNLENTRKFQFQNNIKQIIDLTEEGNDSQKPQNIIQNNSQPRIASNGNYMIVPHQYVVCND